MPCCNCGQTRDRLSTCSLKLNGRFNAMTTKSPAGQLETQTEHRESFKQVGSLRSLGIIGAIGFMIGTVLILCKYCHKKQKELVSDHSTNAVEFNEESAVSSPLLKNVLSSFDEYEYHSQHTKCKNALQEVKANVPKSLLFFKCPEGIRSLKNTNKVITKNLSILRAQCDSKTTNIRNGLSPSESDTDMENSESYACFTKFKYLENIPTNGDFKPIYQELIRSMSSQNTCKLNAEIQTKTVDTCDSRISGTGESTLMKNRLETTNRVPGRLCKVEFATYTSPHSNSVDFLESSKMRPQLPEKVTKTVVGWQERQPFQRTTWSGNCAADQFGSVGTLCTQLGECSEEYYLAEKENMRPSRKQFILQETPTEPAQTLNNHVISQFASCERAEELRTVRRFQLTVTKLTKTEQQTDITLEKEILTEPKLYLERLTTQTEHSETILSPDSTEGSSLPCISIVID